LFVQTFGDLANHNPRVARREVQGLPPRPLAAYSCVARGAIGAHEKLIALGAEPVLDTPEQFTA